MQISVSQFMAYAEAQCCSHSSANYMYVEVRKNLEHLAASWVNDNQSKSNNKGLIRSLINES